MHKKCKVDWGNKKYIQELCKEAMCYSDVCKVLKLVPSANIRTLKKYIERYEIDISHFDPFYNRKGPSKNRTPLSKILTENSTFHRWHLKNRLLDEKILENECKSCGQSSNWNGKLLNMHLDHINGINDDNRLRNLQLLCPNCHSQTETYAGRNRGK